MAFIGFGAGVPNSGFYYEPMFAPSIYARIAPDDSGASVGVTNGPVEHIGHTLGAAGDGTHRVRISWTHTAQVFAFEIHRNYTGGPFVPSTAIGPVVVTDTFAATNSRIFFGGAGNVTFDNLLVFTGFAGTPGAKNCHGKSVSALAQLFGGLENAVLALGFLSVDELQDSIKESCKIE